MSKWCLSVVNADQRSAFEFVHVSGFRAPTSDEAQRAWLNLTKLEYGLLMDISSLIPDTSLACKKLPAPDSEAALRPNDPYANREMARVAIGARELSLDEFLRQQRIVNNGARAASLVLFNAGMYIYRHLNAYNKATRPFQPQSFENVSLWCARAFATTARRNSPCSAISQTPTVHKTRALRSTARQRRPPPFCGRLRLCVGAAGATARHSGWPRPTWCTGAAVWCANSRARSPPRACHHRSSSSRCLRCEPPPATR